MDTKAYDRLRQIVYEQSGISINDGKKSMVAARIGKRLRALQLDCEMAYIDYLEGAMETEIVHLLDAISTNVTSFYREAHHFELVEKAMAKWLSQGQGRFRFWSAACSTGEEPYTLAMTLSDSIRRANARPDIRILATDISTRVLKHAESGVYSGQRVETIPDPQRKRYFKAESAEDTFRISPQLKQMVLFKRFNLSKPPFPMKGPMDIILCRNVMIYFDDVVRSRLLAEFHRLLRPDGLLMVGHAESLSNASDRFTRVGPSTYQPVH